MLVLLHVLTALLFTLVVGFLFTGVFGRRGPWSAVWIFFVLLFLVTWVGGVWTNPFGPVFLGVSWLPFLFFALVFALVVASIPSATPAARAEAEVAADDALGLFFWMLLVVLGISLVGAYL